MRKIPFIYLINIDRYQYYVINNILIVRVFIKYTFIIYVFIKLIPTN